MTLRSAGWRNILTRYQSHPVSHRRDSALRFKPALPLCKTAAQVCVKYKPSKERAPVSSRQIKHVGNATMWPDSCHPAFGSSLNLIGVTLLQERLKMTSAQINEPVCMSDPTRTATNFFPLHGSWEMRSAMRPPHKAPHLWAFKCSTLHFCFSKDAASNCEHFDISTLTVLA